MVLSDTQKEVLRQRMRVLRLHRELARPVRHTLPEEIRLRKQLHKEQETLKECEEMYQVDSNILNHKLIIQQNKINQFGYRGVNSQLEGIELASLPPLALEPKRSSSSSKPLLAIEGGLEGSTHGTALGVYKPPTITPDENALVPTKLGKIYQEANHLSSVHEVENSVG